MSEGGLPESVRRHLYRPLWITAAVVAAVALVGLLDARSTARHNGRLDGGVAATGTVEEHLAGRAVSIRYQNPVTDQEISVAVDVWSAPVPDVGNVVDLDVARRDPEEVALRGDREPLTSELWWYLPLPAVPLAVHLLRRRSHRRAEELIEGTGTSFAMIGAVSPPGFLGRRCDLALYPLDSAPGSPPIGTVSLVSTAAMPVGGPAVPVEVKGVPRPLGRVVGRAGDRILWPAGRALTVNNRPRPEQVVEVPELAPSPRPSPETGPAATGRAAPRRTRAESAGLSGPTLVVALGATLAVLALVTVVTLGRSAQAAELLRSGTPVVVEVVERGSTDVLVSLPGPAGSEAIQVRAGVHLPGNYEVGRRYPAHLSADGDGRLRLDREPYDSATPITWGAIPAGALLVVAARRPWASYRVRRALRAGPTVRVDLVDDEAGHVRVRPPGADYDLLRVPLSPPTSVSRRTALASGDIEVGSWVALRSGGELLPVAGRSLPPVRSGGRGPRWRRPPPARPPTRPT